jgi:hypothetical protein
MAAIIVIQIQKLQIHRGTAQRDASASGRIGMYCHRSMIDFAKGTSVGH